MTKKFKVTIELPKVGRKRLIGAGVLSATATTLWIAAPAYLPWAVVSPEHVLEGFAIPFGVGVVALLFMEYRIARDLEKPAERPSRSEREKADAR